MSFPTLLLTFSCLASSCGSSSLQKLDTSLIVPSNTIEALESQSYEWEGFIAHVIANPTGFSDKTVELAEQWQTHHAARIASRLELKEIYLASMNTALEDNDMISALANASMCINLSNDPDTYRTTEVIEGVRQQAENAAKEAEANKEWLTALRYYRLLASLGHPTQPYYEDIKRLSNLELILGTYDPERLFNMYQAQSSIEVPELGEEESSPDPEAGFSSIEPTPWQETLAGVDASTTYAALNHCQTEHISRTELTALLLSGIARLELLLSTAPLTDVLPEHLTEDRYTAFNAHLTAIKDDLNTEGRVLSYRAATRIIADIVDAAQRELSLPPAITTYELTQGCLDELDPFTAIIWPSQVPEFQRMMEGNFSGVGVQISMQNGRLICITPIVGTPAMEAGMMAGDVITHVDGASISGWSTDRAIRHITGPEGTQVTLTIEREGTEPFDLNITRATIELQATRGFTRRPSDEEVLWDYWLDKEAGIGYIRVDQFLPDCTASCDNAIKQLEAEGTIKGLIIDLRNNPGGLLSEAVSLVDRFIDEGPIVGAINGRGVVSQAFNAKSSNTWGNFPVVVLINNGSASASEIVSGALQEHKRALIIGTNTFGKGSVQRVYGLPGNAGMRITIEHYTLPTGRIIHRHPGDEAWGIAPDVTIHTTVQERTACLLAWRSADIIADGRNPVEDEVNAEQIIAEGLDPQLSAAYLSIIQMTQE